jgi:hypothetical protein
MNTLLVAILFTVLCLAFYIYDNWSCGFNLLLTDSMLMFLVSVIPVVNICIVFYLILKNHSGHVIMKGRGR